MPEEINDVGKIDSVSAIRYAEIVAELRKLVETANRIQFTVGDYAVEVEPMRESGGQERSDSQFTVAARVSGWSGQSTHVRSTASSATDLT